MEISSAKTSPLQAQQAVKRAPSQPQAQSQTVKSHEAEAAKVAEHKPVTNTQGQSTGRLLNVTA